MINLPKDFEIRMQDMLKDAYPDFVRSYDGKKCQALRVNTLKTGVEEFLEKQGFFDRDSARRVPWESRGFYYEETAQPGKHPFHEAGVYYIQEPSAMLPVSLLGARPNEKILDLCAAPGGKSTQIAAYMENEGFLMCNEIHPARAKILSQNIERMGIKNALVTNETPQKLSGIFSEYFDRILVDAPCSGEGMFRKNEEAIGEWSLENVRICAERQAAILDCADLMLRAGGTLVYSTCTFSREENEENVEGFLQRHSDYELIRMERLYPHMVEGEGHFAAVLKKGGDVPEGYQGFVQNGLQKGIGIKEVKELADFQNENLNLKNFKSKLLEEGEERIVKFGEQLYLMPKGMPSVAGLKVLRAGLHLGEIKKNRFEPSHALALSLKGDEAAHCMELGSDENAMRYLNGQTFNFDGEKGWYLVQCCGYSIGWGKLAGGIMKNHYPKGLRK